jgi:predicted nucleic acid-binding protein
VHIAVMRQHGINQVFSADRHFDSIPDITRLDPLTWPI